jgi:hypothetical protein
MISEQAIKERAMRIDPCAFKSYSGSARRDAQREALDQARNELEAVEAVRAHTIKCDKCGWSFTPPMKGGCDHRDCEYTPQPRRYSIDEIDRMRKAICRVQRFNPFERPMREPSVEAQLRTAMLGGVTPQELEDKADLYWEAIRARREARRREREIDDALHAGSRATRNAELIVADVPVNAFWKNTLVRRIERAILSYIGVRGT